MALETLKGIKEIGGFKIIRIKPESMTWDEFDSMRDEYPINITDRMNTISFRLQNGPIGQNGVNGCQVDTMIEASMIIIKSLNENFPCKENEKAIEKLTEALFWIEERKRDRTKRGVEGLNKK